MSNSSEVVKKEVFVARNSGVSTCPLVSLRLGGRTVLSMSSCVSGGGSFERLGLLNPYF